MDSINRNAKILIGAVVTLANDLFGFHIPESVQLAFLALIGVAVTASNIKTMANKKAKLAGEASDAKTPAEVAANLGGAVVP